jgi:hypothetical protein
MGSLLYAVSFLNKGVPMYISQDDLSELKRLAANTYEQEKSEQIHRIIRGINRLESAVASLTAENAKLKKAAG